MNTLVGSKKLFYDKSISITAGGLSITVLKLDEDVDFSVDYILTLCSDTREDIEKALEELKQAGDFYEENNDGNVVYHVFEEPRTIQ